jgi:hypothetical protein
MSDSDLQLMCTAFLGKLIFNEIQINTFCVFVLYVSVLLISSISSRSAVNEYQDNEKCKF